MEGFGGHLEFTRYVAHGLTSERFTLFDIGCSGGIDAGWRSLGEKLNAFGFDPNLHEIGRLRKAEGSLNVSYQSGYVAMPPDHPFMRLKADSPNIIRCVWSRLAVSETIKRQEELREQLSIKQKTIGNMITGVHLSANRESIILSDFIIDHDVRSIDFIKIDVDGKDFEILQSISEVIGKLQTLAFCLEVNFIGSENPADHTFHNTDRFMRMHDFDLFYLSVRHYSNRHLPARYVYSFPAQSMFGRPLQGDALFVKDICANNNQSFASELSAEKKLKLAMIYSLFSLPDCAAEILRVFCAELAPIIDCEGALDVLARQAQDISRIGRPSAGYMSYNEYIKAFRDDVPDFYFGVGEEESFSRKGLTSLYSTTLEQPEYAARNLEVNLYGGLQPPFTIKGDAVAFAPTSSRDHLASGFFAVRAHAAAKPDCAIVLELDWPLEAGSRATVVLQTTGFDTLARIEGSAPTAYWISPAMPAAKCPEELRVALLFPDEGECVLPRAVRVLMRN